MGGIFRALLRLPILQPLLRPITRFLFGMIAIPLFRIFLRHVVRLQDLDKELEKDLEQWFRGSLLLLAATANMEHLLFGWVPLSLQDENAWIMVGLRLMLAVGIIEAMPDQELFAVIHPGPPRVRFTKLFTDLYEKWWEIIRGVACKHLNRSSPVFVIMAAIFDNTVGWVCYGVAIVQYLIIGLVTSRDKAMDVLGEFDRQVALRRREIIEEFELDDQASGSADQSDADLVDDTLPEEADDDSDATNGSTGQESATSAAAKG